MLIKQNGFTLIEMVVILGITLSLMVAVGGIMSTSYRAKNNGDIKEFVQDEAQMVMQSLKKNIFYADKTTIICPSGVGSSLVFNTLDGGQTTLICDSVTGKIASISAKTGRYNLSGNGVVVKNCQNFLSCQIMADLAVQSVDFNLNIGVTANSVGDQFWNFMSKVVLR